MRKLVILAREAGYDIEPDQVRVESLVPAHCEEGSVDHFENGEELNEQMLQRLEAARELGLVLRYVARFDANGKRGLALKPSARSIRWRRCCRAITSLPSRAAGTAIIRWSSAARVPAAT